MHWRTKFSQVKRSLGKAYNTSRRVLSIADRAHAFFSQIFNMVQDRFDPQVRETLIQLYERMVDKAND